MSSHTPGPWHAHMGYRWSHVKSANGDYIMEANYRAIARQHADARLIAAAPEMLDAVVHAEAWISKMPHGDNCFLSDHYDGDPGASCNCGKEGLLHALQEVIAKATGEQS